MVEERRDAEDGGEKEERTFRIVSVRLGNCTWEGRPDSSSPPADHMKTEAWTVISSPQTTKAAGSIGTSQRGPVKSGDTRGTPAGRRLLRYE